MPVHLVVDGSNIATEGRTHPSIHQLREAVQALAAEHPSAKVIVVVDATFGHRIDPAEVPEFDAAVANNELVAPPAGAIGRGDAFVLGIADKVNGSILSNDSYQEFHGQYAWLFDEGRLIGGKPVPHVGWVFVNRLPVRGPLSRKSVSEAKRKGGRSKGPTAPLAGDGSVRVGSVDANQPMPVPTAPPPGAVLSRAAKKAAAASSRSTADNAASKKAAKQTRAERPAPAVSERASGHEPLNDQFAFLTFVSEHPVGAAVDAVVDHYSSHGAYVRIGDVKGYVPLRLMGTPPPTSARSAMKIGETVHLVVHQYVAAKRSIDLAVAAAGAASADSATTSRRGSATSTAGLRKAAAAVEPAPRAGTTSGGRAKATAAGGAPVAASPKVARAAKSAVGVAAGAGAAPAKSTGTKRTSTTTKNGAAARGTSTRPATAASAPAKARAGAKPAPAKAAPARTTTAKAASAKAAPAKTTTAKAASAKAAPAKTATAKAAPASTAGSKAAKSVKAAPARAAKAASATTAPARSTTADAAKATNSSAGAPTRQKAPAAKAVTKKSAAGATATRRAKG